MTATAPGALKRTPLHDVHVALGARIVPFAGYEMPVTYPQGITAEHNAVRQACGMFDVSHMGECLVRGPDAVRFVNAVTSNDVAALAVGQAHYSTLLREDGTIVDDLLVYRFADHLMLVLNASNKEKDLAHLRAHMSGFGTGPLIETSQVSSMGSLLLGSRWRCETLRQVCAPARRFMAPSTKAMDARPGRLHSLIRR